VTVPHLGCVADDFTGATDLAGALAQAGHRTTVSVGADGIAEAARDADAVVVALKTRTVPPGEAVAAALGAHRRLAGAGCTRYWFKYCSTFDSTPEGNIGPVTDALLTATASPYTVACPAYPDNGRTVYQGHLFVGDRLLSESGMRHHPLTPMTDPDLVRWLAAQSRHPVGLLPLQALRAGDGPARDRLAAEVATGARTVVTDAVEQDDLARLERLVRDLPLLTGGAGLARALPPPAHGDGTPACGIDVADGPCAVLAGSVSPTTLAQTAHARSRLPARKLAVADLLRDPAGTAAEAADWARRHTGDRPVLMYSADDREEVTRAQHRYGAAAAAEAVEKGLAACAVLLLDAGVRRLVVAGGETSGAVVAALGLRSLRIGPAVAPGVPWTAAHHRGHTVNLVLKSGNFGRHDLFTAAEDAL
jgi:uncharacterized protein YgbK (DUF1537 family)